MVDRTAAITPGDVLCFVCLRNEAPRLPHFLAHHRALGVRHFLIVDNASTDGTADLLRDQPDVSLWQTGGQLQGRRFGMDWLTWLMLRHGHGPLVPDAGCRRNSSSTPTGRPAPARPDQLAGPAGPRQSFGALTVDMYPARPGLAGGSHARRGPAEAPAWFDAGQLPGPGPAPDAQPLGPGRRRGRGPSLPPTPRRAPTLNKTPLVRWHWRYAYVNSTHALLPPRLNRVYDTDGGELTSGVLLHTKFLTGITDRSAEEKARGEHFGDAAQYAAYYDRLTADPVLHCAGIHPLHRLAAVGGAGPDVARAAGYDGTGRIGGGGHGPDRPSVCGRGASICLPARFAAAAS